MVDTRINNAKELFAAAESVLLKTGQPSVYFVSDSCPLRRSAAFEPLFALEGVKQSPKHHPEGDAFVHSMLVVDEAAVRKELAHDPAAPMWAALLHDLGKASTTRVRRGRITSYDHDKAGEKLALGLIKSCGQLEGFAVKVAALVRYHMHPLYVLGNMPFADIDGMLRSVDLHDLCLLALCDRMGRTGADEEAETEAVRRFSKAVQRH